MSAGEDEVKIEEQPGLPVAEEVQALRDSDLQMRKQLVEQRRRESRAVLKAAICEQEKRKREETIEQMQTAMLPPSKQVRSLMLDPSVNAEIRKLREQVKQAEKKEKEVQQELEASQFQASSIAGKKLMQKCKELQAENEQLGKELSEGKVQKLHATIALQKDYAKELRKALGESREWVNLLDEELEAAQGTILQLRRDLQAARAAKATPSPPPPPAAAPAERSEAENDALVEAALDELAPPADEEVELEAEAPDKRPRLEAIFDDAATGAGGSTSSFSFGFF